MPEKILVALGGNALIRHGQQGTIEEQTATLQLSLAGVVELIRQGHQLVLTHGNGPQVGHILIRVEQARGHAYDLPLDVCVAQSQGEIGFLIQQALDNLLHERGIHRSVAVVLTRVVVDKSDPRMRSASKPIGPFLSPEQVAVVDKDFASSLLALKIGVNRIIDLTGVNYVKLNFASPQETDLKTMTVAEAKRHLADGHFLPGSMGPKIEAAIDFLEHGGREVIVTLPELALEAFQGAAGTHIYPDEAYRSRHAPRL